MSQTLQYLGHETMTYMDYLDVNTGKTLTCVPGQTYTFVPASGHAAPMSAVPGDGRFTVGSGRGTEKETIEPEKADLKGRVTKTSAPEKEE